MVKKKIKKENKKIVKKITKNNNDMDIKNVLAVNKKQNKVIVTKEQVENAKLELLKKRKYAFFKFATISGIVLFFVYVLAKVLYDLIFNNRIIIKAFITMIVNIIVLLMTTWWILIPLIITTFILLNRYFINNMYYNEIEEQIKNFEKNKDDIILIEVLLFIAITIILCFPMVLMYAKTHTITEGLMGLLTIYGVLLAISVFALLGAIFGD